MLARNFKDAAELGIKPDQHDALITVLGMMERGEIPDRNFDMKAISSAVGDCGTAYCIAGWCEEVTHNRGLFSFYQRPGDTPDALYELFMFGDDRRFGVTMDQAIHALTNYLTTGDADWASALT